MCQFQRVSHPQNRALVDEPRGSCAVCSVHQARQTVSPSGNSAPKTLPKFFNPEDLALGEKWLNLQKRDEMYIAVAEIDGVAVGRSRLLYNYKGDPPNAAFATSVSAEWRSRGIGSALVAHNERVAHSRGMYHLSSHTGKDNPRAAAWRERMGYRRVGEETIHWEEVDGRQVESLCWKFERTFTPPASYRIRQWVRIRVSKLRRRLVAFRRKPT